MDEPGAAAEGGGAMPGMSSGLDPSDPTVVGAFYAALLHQAIGALVIFAVLWLAWVAARDRYPAAGSVARPGPLGGPGLRGVPGLAGWPELASEPGWRRVLRVGFGILWLFDGLLQAQPAMAVGMPSQVIEPAAASSPGWVQHLVNWAATTWSYHPVQAGAAAVWIQAGIGLWLLFAARGPLSRLAGLASVGWGLVVWVFGESFGAIFAPGLSWLTGAPGGVLFYCAAGAIIAVPARAGRSPRLARLLAGGTGLFLAGMAVLQAWPGRGFWQGTLGGRPGPLTSMVSDMAGTSQPRALAGLVSRFGFVVTAHGFAVNLVAVASLGVAGVALVAAALAGPGGWPGRRPGVLGAAGVLLAVLCLADWVLVQDLGFFGGVGTDPNSMIPMLLVGGAAIVGLRGAAGAAGAGERAAGAARAGGAGWLAGVGRGAGGRPRRSRVRPADLAAALAATSPRAIGSAAAVGVILLGAVPMAAAQASPDASPILAESINGPGAPLAGPAPGFILTDQDGRRVALAGLRGKAVLLTFLDPVCVSGCQSQAREFRQASQQLRGDGRRVMLVAVNLNPVYDSPAYARAFDREQGLTGLPNWLFLTGRPALLQAAWRDYGIASQPLGPGMTLGHSDAAFVIGPDGRLREELNFDPGPGTAATRSSFATELAAAARQSLAG
ncbi:MAG TPA: SCO family protein [Streptosporangiaceae bacterium]|nr:SCO family protein [Streptosporangiaceae bacterium]